MLSHKFSIYVPSTMDTNKETDNTKKVNETLSFLSSLFGGATKTDAFGAWVSATAGLVTEKVSLCYAYCSLIDKYKHIKKVKEFARNLKNEMNQEAVSLEIDGKLLFV